MPTAFAWAWVASTTWRHVRDIDDKLSGTRRFHAHPKRWAWHPAGVSNRSTSAHPNKLTIRSRCTLAASSGQRSTSAAAETRPSSLGSIFVQAAAVDAAFAAQLVAGHLGEKAEHVAAARGVAAQHRGQAFFRVEHQVEVGGNRVGAIPDEAEGTPVGGAAAHVGAEERGRFPLFLPVAGDTLADEITVARRGSPDPAAAVTEGLLCEGPVAEKKEETFGRACRRGRDPRRARDSPRNRSRAHQPPASHPTIPGRRCEALMIQAVAQSFRPR